MIISVLVAVLPGVLILTPAIITTYKNITLPDNKSYMCMLVYRANVYEVYYGVGMKSINKHF